MALFGIFKKDKTTKAPKGYYSISVKTVSKLTSESVKITLDIPSELKQDFQFTPGQYVSLSVWLNGSEERRSYSLCNGPNEDIAIGVKAVSGGKVSNFLCSDLKSGDTLYVAKPQGNFTLKKDARNIVCVAAGSGITPILSILKAIQKTETKARLFYGNRTLESILFKDELNNLSMDANYFLSGADLEGYTKGRINKENFTEVIKNDLSILKSDAFYLCGPEAMINDIQEALTFFGVSKEKIHFELFTTPTESEQQIREENNFTGTSKITIVLDDESSQIELSATGKSILDAANDAGIDAPYSCRGGVCSSCKAKVVKGNATMKLNYSLSNQEVADGYVLTCQAHPASDEVTISYDI